jgi:Fe-S-cluster containining protein
MTARSKHGSCACPLCVKCCENNPGWMTPTEGRKAMKSGLAKRLMRDWLEPCSKYGNDERIYLLAPASEGCEGDDAPEGDLCELLFGDWSKGRCTFLEKDRCAIQDNGFKPKQCRLSWGCADKYIDNYAMARPWDTSFGRATVERWRKLVAELAEKPDG